MKRDFYGRFKIKYQIIYLILAVSSLVAADSFAQTTEEVPQDIGMPYPGHPQPDGAFRGLTEIGTQLDLSYMYTHLRGDDMSGAYGGLSQFGAAVSFATGARTRFFLSAHYGQQSGDPYHSIDGFSNEDGITVKALPLMLGLKINASQKQSFRLYFGGAFQYTFLWEDVTTGGVNDQPMDVEASGTGTGFYLFVGPEFPLGQGSSALGAEFGYGGSRGDVKASSHRHGVDLTGVHARIYYTFGL